MPTVQIKFPLLFVLPLLLAFFVWQLEIDSFGASEGTGSPQNLPQAIVENPRIQIYGREGLLRQSFAGTSLVSLRDGDELQIELPRFELADGNGDFWSLDAAEGLYDQQRDQLRLRGSVQMIRTTGNLPVQLHTDELQLDLSGSWLRSSSLVQIKSVGHLLRGTGLVANLRDGQFELLRDVEAIHEITP